MSRKQESTTRELSQYKTLLENYQEYEITESDISILCEILGGCDANAIDGGFRLGFVRGFKAALSDMQ